MSKAETHRPDISEGSVFRLSCRYGATRRVDKREYAVKARGSKLALQHVPRLPLTAPLHKLLAPGGQTFPFSTTFPLPLVSSHHLQLLNPQAQAFDNVDHTSAEWRGLLREIVLLSSLDHPHVVRFREAFLSSGGVACLVMELLQGDTRAQTIT